MNKRRLLIITVGIILLLNGCGKKEISGNQQSGDGQNVRKRVAMEESDIIWKDSEIREEENAVKDIHEKEPVIEENPNIEEETLTKKTTEFENGLLFSTEYDIEDYCSGYFIVSKNDGLLWGILDMGGKEWVPCEYDEISFMNKSKFTDNQDDTLLIKLRYENLYTVMNQSGEKILHNVEGISVGYADYEIGKISENSVAFWQSYTVGEQKKGIRLYNKAGNTLLEVELEGVTEFGVTGMISENVFIANSSLNYDHHKTYLYSMSGENIKQWEGVSALGTHGFGNDYADKAEVTIYHNGYTLWLVDTNGNTEGIGEYSNNEYEHLVEQEIYSNVTNNMSTTEYSNECFNLYHSNNTWKLEKLDGTPLYEQRYYMCKAYSIDGKDWNLFILSDENDEAIVVNRFGQKVMDKGWMTLRDSKKGYTEAYFKGSPFDSYYCYVEDSGICYIQGHDVYYFQPIE